MMRAASILFLVAVSVSATFAFDKIILYGDSFSDNGNDYKHSGYPPSPPYWQGRFSNGPTWFEYVMKGLPKYDVSDNGYGGATTHNADVYSEFNHWVVPGLQQQVETLDTQGTPESLYIIYIGYNDLNSIINPDYYNVINSHYTTEKIVVNVVSSVKLLQTKYGAKDFLVLNTPPFYHWPVVADGDKERTRALINTYNADLTAALQLILGVSFRFLDDNSWFEEQIAHPEKLGLSTTNGPCVVETTACSDPENHFFFDTYHPEAKVHKAFGAWALEKLHELYNL